ncbi:hypothetical protein FB451DRAFT_1524105 [Mycena latifolia]|nr:hypothetical protein FB451DRAFT_1524105 [Mycena latifolia]
MAERAPLTIALLGGTGDLGTHLLRAFSAHPAAASVRLRLLTRPASAERAYTLAAPYDNLYLTVHPIDYTAPEGEMGLEAALCGVDVVLSAVKDDSGMGAKARGAQRAAPGLPRAGRRGARGEAAGVKLLVPSEYGAPTHALPLDSPAFVVGKRRHIELLRTLELPSLLVYAGAFPDHEPAPTPLPPRGADAPLGEPPFETTRHHLATYIVDLLLERDVAALAGGIYVLRGLRCERGVVSAETGKTEWVVDG